MKIKLKSNLLLIKKHKNTRLSVDMAVEESDEDKNLITGEIVEVGTDVGGIKSVTPKHNYAIGDTVIFGKYALLTLKLKGENYHILDVEDVLGTTEYSEK